MENNGGTKSTGLNLTVNCSINSKWNMNFTSYLSYIQVRGEVDGSAAMNEGLKGNFAFSSGYRFDNGWRVNVNMNYLLTPEILL